MSCEPFSVSLEVNPTELRKIIFELDKTCKDQNTAEWTLKFDLQERKDPNADFRSLVKLNVVIDVENNDLAEATAHNGMDDDQLAQATVAGDTAKDFSQGKATKEDAEDDAQAVITARNPASPGVLA